MGMNEEHMAVLFDSFISLIKPFADTLTDVHLSYSNGFISDAVYEGDFENGKEIFRITKEFKKEDKES